MLTAQAIAQSTQTLPQVTVEGKKGSAAKKGAAKGAPKAAPQQQAEPVQQVETQAAKEKAKKDAVYNTPAAVSTATKSELDTFGQVDTGDVLRSMPGTFTRENVNNPGIAVNIRGFEGSGRVNMMLDGVRQNFRFVGHEARGFMYVDPQLLAGIDIERGAVVTTGGAGALAGTANFRTLDVEDIIKPGQSTGVLTSATYGTNGIGWSEMFATGARTNAFGIAGAISKREQENYKNGDGIRVPFTDQDSLSGLFKTYIKPTEDSKISFGGVFYGNDFSANSYFQNITAQTLTAGYVYQPRNNSLIDFKANAYSTTTEMTYLRGLNSFATSVGRRIEDEGFGFDVSNKSRFRTGALGIVLEYGGEYFTDQMKTANGGVNADGESSIAGAFTQATFSYGVFDLITGLRYDHFTLDGSGTVPASAVGPDAPLPAGPFVVDQSEGRLNPKLTLAARAAPWLQFYGTYSESMRAPTTTETIGGGSHPGSNVAGSLFPNPFLKPEVQKGFEFGANVRANGIVTRGDAFRLKAAYFDMDVTDYVVTCEFATATSTNFYFCNVPGESRVHGVELEGQYDAGKVFAGFSYTYSRSDLPNGLTNFGAHTYLPDHYGTLTLGARFLDQKLTVGARGFAASEGDAPGLTNSKTAGYALLDLFTSYKLPGGLEIGGTVTNLFDTTYTPATTTPNTSSCVPFPTPCPAEPETGRGRTFLITARGQF